MKSKYKFLVMGSAKLDYYSRGGDSLQGRYHYHCLHPIHIDESGDIDRLMRFGGFPEPFLEADSRHWQRWQNERHKRVIHEDLVSLERVREISRLDLLASVLPERVGSLLSVKKLAKDLGVAFETVDRWLNILENLYVCFRISPFGHKTLQTAKKERKLFMWDWSLCEGGARSENFLASYLLKYVHFRQDYYGERYALCFLRDREQRELDFVLVKNKEIIAGFESKSGSGDLSPWIRYFSRKTDIPQFFQVHHGDEDVILDKYRARIIPVGKLSEVFPVG